MYRSYCNRTLLAGVSINFMLCGNCIDMAGFVSGVIECLYRVCLSIACRIKTGWACLKLFYVSTNRILCLKRMAVAEIMKNTVKSCGIVIVGECN